MFHLTLAKDLKQEEAMMGHLLLLSKIFRLVGLIKQCTKVSLLFKEQQSDRGLNCLQFQPTQWDLLMGTHNILTYKLSFKSSCAATLWA